MPSHTPAHRGAGLVKRAQNKESAVNVEALTQIQALAQLIQQLQGPLLGDVTSQAVGGGRAIQSGIEARLGNLQGTGIGAAAFGLSRGAIAQQVGQARLGLGQQALNLAVPGGLNLFSNVLGARTQLQIAQMQTDAQREMANRQLFTQIGSSLALLPLLAQGGGK